LNGLSYHFILQRFSLLVLIIFFITNRRELKDVFKLLKEGK
jgi:hypothetical protein